MRGTIPQKVCRLAADLVSHPGYIPRYVRHNVMNGSSPLDLEIPWFSYAAIDFLEGWLQPNMTVCEYGSGGSTIFFARRVKSVLSIEDNREWYQRVKERLQQQGIANATLALAPYDFKKPVNFEESDYLNAIPNSKFDVIVVDGTEEWTPVRPVCFSHAEKYVKPGGIIVVDDSWRYPTIKETNKAKRMTIFKSVGPCRPGVTTTDIYFY